MQPQLSKIQMDKNTLSVKIKTREATMFEGEAKSVTSFNLVGRFDVLPLHSNFISLIQREVIIQKKDGGQEVVPVQDGVMRVSKNKVEIFLGLKALAEIPATNNV